MRRYISIYWFVLYAGMKGFDFHLYFMLFRRRDATQFDFMSQSCLFFFKSSDNKLELDLEIKTFFDIDEC